MGSRESVLRISESMNGAVIRQQDVVQRLLIARIADGHVLDGSRAGAVQGVRVMTPTGQTYSRGSSIRIGAGPLDAGAVHRSTTANFGPFGAAVARRWGFVDRNGK